MTDLDTHKTYLWIWEHKFFVHPGKIKYDSDKRKIGTFLDIFSELYTFWALKRRAVRNTAPLTYLIEYLRI